MALVGAILIWVILIGSIWSLVILAALSIWFTWLIITLIMSALVIGSHIIAIKGMLVLHQFLIVLSSSLTLQWDIWILISFTCFDSRWALFSYKRGSTFGETIKCIWFDGHIMMPIWLSATVDRVLFVYIQRFLLHEVGWDLTLTKKGIGNLEMLYLANWSLIFN